MASVSWLGFTQLVQNMVAGVQAATLKVVDATVGSITLAWTQAVSGAALFLQGQAAQVTALTRLQTSFGNDVDTFVDTFGMDRLGATYATTTETFSRFTATQTALIPAGTGGASGPSGSGAMVSTGPGGIQFMVITDTTNAYWNAAQNGYLIPVNTTSITVPIQCLTAGTAGNVLAATITSFFQPIPGVDTCTNPASVTNGIAAESDPAVKARFPIYLLGLASADIAAIISAIIGTQQNLIYIPVENYNYPGNAADNGSFFIIVDDGSHNPPSSLLTAVYNAVYPIRGFCIRLQGVYGPTATPINMTGTIAVTSGYVAGSVVQAVEAAWSNWIQGFYAAWAAPAMQALLNGQPITISPPLITLAEAAAVAMGVPGVANITLSSIQINGSNADLQLTLVEAPEPGTISVAS